MRKVGIIGATIIFASSVGVAFAQERAPQHVGYGTGVGDSQGVGDRSRVMDEGDMLRYLSAPETIMGEIVAIDYPAGKLYIDMGGSSHDERQSLTGSLNMKELWFDGKTNMQNLKAVHQGDYVSIQAVNETTDSQQFGTGKKIVRTVYVLEGTQVLGGADNEDFGGGFSQRPNPYKYRGIHTRTAGYTGVPEGGIQQGNVQSGITSTIGVVTGAAPCWQCAPQPDTINKRTDKTIATDYGDGRDNFNKGTVQ
ncbi:MAG: hypothetical protein ACQ9IQ_00535 [Nitrospirales bacterium]|jgi:hypothetical protein